MSSSERTEQADDGGDRRPKRTHVTHAEELGDVFVAARRPGDTQDTVIRLDEPDAETLFWQLGEWLGYDHILPEWEVGVQESDDEDSWEFYHPMAADPLSAREKALKAASEDFADPEVYQSMCLGNDDRALGRMELGRYPDGRYQAWHTDEYQEFMEGIEP